MMDETSYLTRQIRALGRAIYCARQASPTMVPDLERLRDQMLNRLKGLHYRNESDEKREMSGAIAGISFLLLAILGLIGFLMHR